MSKYLLNECFLHHTPLTNILSVHYMKNSNNMRYGLFAHKSLFIDLHIDYFIDLYTRLIVKTAKSFDFG
jgi:hypothetical protein